MQGTYRYRPRCFHAWCMLHSAPFGHADSAPRPRGSAGARVKPPHVPWCIMDWCIMRHRAFSSAAHITPALLLCVLLAPVTNHHPHFLCSRAQLPCRPQDKEWGIWPTWSACLVVTIPVASRGVQRASLGIFDRRWWCRGAGGGGGGGLAGFTPGR